MLSLFYNTILWYLPWKIGSLRKFLTVFKNTDMENNKPLSKYIFIHGPRNKAYRGNMKLYASARCWSMCSLPPRLEKALNIISRVLSEINARWVLVGGTASCLNGVEVEPKDIDIIIEADKIYEVDKIFASNFQALRRVKYSSSEVYSSHYGVFEILGVKVEIMAELKICGKPGCLEVDFEELYHHSRNLKIGDVNIRVAPLEWQLVANSMIPGKKERVIKILKILRTKGVNTDILNNILNKASPEVRIYLKTLGL